MMPRQRPFILVGTLCWLMAAFASQVFAQAPLFPQSFLVEHQVVQTDARGDRTVVGPVKDYYGASWIVSVQPDGGRTIVDFSRDRMTVVDVERGQYATLSFGRLGELKRRYRLAEFGPQEKMDEPSDREALEISVVEAPAAAKSVPTGDDALTFERPGVRQFHVQASRDGKELGALDLWLDSEIHLSPRALDAVERFERSMLGRSTTEEILGFQDLLAEGRRGAGGALVLGAGHSLVFGQAPEEVGRMDDVALGVDVLGVFPTELSEIPEHFVRVPHPLETIVAHAEREADLRRRMGAEDGR